MNTFAEVDSFDASFIDIGTHGRIYSKISPVFFDICWVFKSHGIAEVGSVDLHNCVSAAKAANLLGFLLIHDFGLFAFFSLRFCCLSLWVGYWVDDLGSQFAASADYVLLAVLGMLKTRDETFAVPSTCHETKTGSSFNNFFPPVFAEGYSLSRRSLTSLSSFMF